MDSTVVKHEDIVDLADKFATLEEFSNPNNIYPHLEELALRLHCELKDLKPDLKQELRLLKSTGKVEEKNKAVVERVLKL